MPPLKEVIPVLEISSYKDWKEFGKWYWHLIKRQYDINDEMKKVLKWLIRPTMSIEDKARMVYLFVISEIRYVAWEYGIHGWKPYRASTIFARRFGDCKDKSTMINVLLNELGIESYPVLIYADESKGKDDLTLPMVEHFNHCISYVPLNKENGIWLDGTAAFNAAGTLPGMDADADVFLINEEGGEIKHTPALTEKDNIRQENNTIRIDKNGDALLEMELVFTGDRGSDFRYYLLNPARRNLVIERMLGGRYGGTKVSSVKTSKLANLEMPASFWVSAEIPKFANKKEADLSFKTIIFPQELSYLTTQSERQFDLVLPLHRYPYKDMTKTEFILPINTQVKSLPENINLNNKFGSFTLDYKITDNKVIMTEVISIKTRRILKEDYKEFREFCNRISREEKREIIFTTE